MATTRPHFSKTGPQLQELFEAGRDDTKKMRELLTELKHRSTPTAMMLRKKVEDVLAGSRTGREPEGDKAEAAAPPAPKPQPPSAPPGPASSPKNQTVACRNCHTSLRVPIRAGRTPYSCPTCKADFETVFIDSVLQVVWIETKRTETTHEAMTDSVARDVLGVGADADFAAIKIAWRKASQQYHPDKHQGLPERLRRAAEGEMKRINEAYRYLEGTTASDF